MKADMITKNKLKTLLIALVLMLCPFFFSTNVNAQEILHFPDTNLEQAIRDELGQQAGLLTPGDLRRLRSLDASRLEISDLTGLEHAVRLESLNLHQNRIRDISPLQNLTAMRELYLDANRITDITPLERMNRLETLHLGHNPLQNVQTLQKLRRLSELRLENVPASKLQILEDLTRLEVLSLDGVDAACSFLQNLTRLQQLSLVGCGQQDLSYLEGLTSLVRLDLQDNELEDISALASLRNLEWLSLENNSITDISALEGMPLLTSINLRGNKLRDIAPLEQIQTPAWVDVRHNYLYLAPGEPATEVIESLEAGETEIYFDPQDLPFYHGNGLVTAPRGSGGKILRTPAADSFTIINPEMGWRIKSFTIEHEEGRPLDFIAEIGRPDAYASFFWTSLSRSAPISVGEKLPHTITLPEASGTRLGLGVQIWPGYADDNGRRFYFSEVLLENIYTGNTYLIEFDPESTGNYTGAANLLTDRRDHTEPREVADLPELQQTIAAALQARDPALTVTAELPHDLDLERDLENIFEDIYATDDYLRYSMQRKSIEWSSRAAETTINFRFHYHATREEEQIVDERVRGILAEIITPQMDEHEITRAVHDFIVANVAYDQSRREHSAYAALVRGYAVCQGYALLAHKMLNEAGIEARIISGEAGGENHAWNLVNLEGNWYHLDATWNDPVPDVPGRVLYDYYNRTDAQMRPTHTWDEDAYPAAVTPYQITW